MSIAEQYETATQHWTDFQSHMHRCVDLVVNLNAQHVIELGVRSGVSTRAWLQGLNVTGGRLTTVDLMPAPHLEHEGVEWVHIQGDDIDSDVRRQVRGEVAVWPADVVFIDTSHTLEQTRLEIHYYWPLTRKAMCFHDLYLDENGGGQPGPVLQAIQEFLMSYNGRGLTFTEFKDSYGFGIIWRDVTALERNVFTR